jgi:hypothetical protein
MNTPKIPRDPPNPDEYASGYEPYIQLVQTTLANGVLVGGAPTDAPETHANAGTENRLLALLESQAEPLDRWARARTETQAMHRYAQGKWCVKQVVGHMADVERVMAYRLLRIARGDSTPMPGFDEDAWVTNAAFEYLPLTDVTRAFMASRASTLAMIRNFDEGAWVWSGTANGVTVSARAILWILAGHAEHHIKMFSERYRLPEVRG